MSELRERALDLAEGGVGVVLHQQHRAQLAVELAMAVAAHHVQRGHAVARGPARTIVRLDQVGIGDRRRAGGEALGAVAALDAVVEAAGGAAVAGAEVAVPSVVELIASPSP